jgi:hypothetical protein
MGKLPLDAADATVHRRSVVYNNAASIRSNSSFTSGTDGRVSPAMASKRRTV